jgi:hypothetical protein
VKALTTDQLTKMELPKQYTGAGMTVDSQLALLLDDVAGCEAGASKEDKERASRIIAVANSWSRPGSKFQCSVASRRLVQLYSHVELVEKATSEYEAVGKNLDERRKADGPTRQHARSLISALENAQGSEKAVSDMSKHAGAAKIVSDGKTLVQQIGDQELASDLTNIREARDALAEMGDRVASGDANWKDDLPTDVSWDAFKTRYEDTLDRTDGDDYEAAKARVETAKETLKSTFQLFRPTDCEEEFPKYWAEKDEFEIDKEEEGWELKEQPLNVDSLLRAAELACKEMDFFAGYDEYRASKQKMLKFVVREEEENLESTPSDRTGGLGPRPRARCPASEWLSACVCARVAVSLPVYLSVHVCVSVRQSPCPFWYLAVCLPACLSVCLSLSVCRGVAGQVEGCNRKRYSPARSLKEMVASGVWERFHQAFKNLAARTKTMASV